MGTVASSLAEGSDWGFASHGLFGATAFEVVAHERFTGWEGKGPS